MEAGEPGVSHHHANARSSGHPRQRRSTTRRSGAEAARLEGRDGSDRKSAAETSVPPPNAAAEMAPRASAAAAGRIRSRTRTAPAGHVHVEQSCCDAASLAVRRARAEPQYTIFITLNFNLIMLFKLVELTHVQFARSFAMISIMRSVGN